MDVESPGCCGCCGQILEEAQPWWPAESQPAQCVELFGTRRCGTALKQLPLLLQAG